MVDQLQHLASCVHSSRPGDLNLRIQGTCASARALVVALVCHETGQPLLCIASEPKVADRFAEELSFLDSLFRFQDDPPSGRVQVLNFPAGLPRPAGLMQASVSAMQERFRVLTTLLEGQGPHVVVSTLDAVLERVPPREVLRQNTLQLHSGAQMDRDELAGFLQTVGFKRVPIVEDPGEYAVRGSLVDLYPLCSAHPFRVDFFGDTVENIRIFQPDSQRSLDPVDRVRIAPAGSFIERAMNRRALGARIKERADALGLPPRTRMEFLARLDAGLPRQEIPMCLPFFYPELETLLDYLGEGPLPVLLDPEKLSRAAEALEEDGTRSLEQLGTKGKILPNLQDLLLPAPEFWQGIGTLGSVSFCNLPFSGPYPGYGGEDAPGPTDASGEQVLRLEAPSVRTVLRRMPEGAPAKGLSAFIPLIRGWIEQGLRVFLVCGNEKERARLAHLLHEYDLPFAQPDEKLPFRDGPAGLYLVRGDLSEGFEILEARALFLHEEDVFGRKARKVHLREAASLPAPDLRELTPGSYVVHIDFGIGQFHGLETLNIRGTINDYLHLEYAKGDKLYLPVDRASRIQKYVSTDDLPPTLDKMGGTSWARIKKKVRESILAMAEELVSLYAVRMVKKGHAFSRSDSSYEEFEASFPFEETPGQSRAIEDVLTDLENERPMDRLVCGDVGFGKTEVAIRAAYKVVMDGKQVAVLVPTTVLAQQHYVNFLKRFEDYPVEIQMLSRFRSPKQQKEILKDLVAGRVDIIVGTHRLVQKDVRFRDLGLLIVDEEQRFGVRQKEAIKKLRSEVDVLTLSATPIPRTLHMSLLSLRDLSTISTPPQDRRAVETFIIPFEDAIVRKALLAELERGGQAFFVHNRVHDIHHLVDKLQQIVPEARFVVGHGQMPERELERVMMEFVEGRHDVLVCTTIIESGLDIPNVNTLLVHRAERFGLAQLYQLRGRVGRSERQAYAYLIVYDEETMTDDARKRLEALYEFTELGSGFRIARHDLEIRGAGNLVGASQSGHIRAVGYDLYMELLEKAIRELKGDQVLEEVDPEIHLDIPAYLPADYVEDSTQRLSFYKRLATAGEDEEVNRIRSEIQDRYGALPEHARTLFELMRIKVRLRRLRIRDARVSEEGLLLAFASQTPVSVGKILEWAAREPDRIRLYPDDRLLIRFSAPDPAQRLEGVRRILSWIESDNLEKEAAHG